MTAASHVYIVTTRGFGQLRVEKIQATTHAEAIAIARKRHGVSIEAALGHGAQLRSERSV